MRCGCKISWYGPWASTPLRPRNTDPVHVVLARYFTCAPGGLVRPAAPAIGGNPVLRISAGHLGGK